ncbi:monocarboxylate transporter 5-like isoform X1 [Chiloscyllium plagiosum]|uniref:monocarboxylate transporter 5-like isoform X1 n=2 Tax=Chiloscyllium plagiosum TaxID=36176 RepID=UPI001CB7B82D|nr:monocarboxylate transporter 5-like isoform X1 [Chiloscyllium plagiosum]
MCNPKGSQRQRVRDPPEGGWGWVIVFDLFAINVLAMGILKSFGILSAALQETFQASMEQIGWIGSILSCVRLTAGPIACIFCAKIGERQTGILGAAMVSTGLFISSFVDRIAFLYVTLGLLAGCGFAFLSQAAALNTTKYFRRKLTTACAISRSGTGLTFAVAPFLQYLLYEYGWRGAILILCGLTLHLIPLGMLNRPIYLKQDQPEDCDRRECHQRQLPDDKRDVVPAGVSRAQLPINRRVKPVRRSLSSQSGLEESNSLQSDLKQAVKPSAADGLSILQPKELSLLQDPVSLRQMHSTALPGCKAQNGDSNPLVATDTIPTDTRHKGLCREFGAQLKSVSDSVKNLIDFTLLTNPLFIIYTICTFFSQLAYFIPYFHVVAKAKALGIEPFQATLLISVAGIVEIVAQLISGYVADRNLIAKYHYHKIYLLFCGAVNLLAPLAKTFPSLMVYIVFLAMFCGGYLTLLLPVLVDFIGVHRIHKGMGLYQFFVGIGCLIGPPAAGALHDYTKNYDASFQLAGSCYFVSFLVLFFIPLAERKLQKETKKRVIEDSTNLAPECNRPLSVEQSPVKEYLELESMV